MQKVLMIAHQFPPMGGAGVQRTVKFVKYLPSLGWLPTILTRDDKNISLKDSTLINDIPKSVEIYRSKAYDLTDLKGIMHIPGKIIARKLLIPDSEKLWQIGCKKLALRLVKNVKFDFLYTTSSPYSDHLLGLHIKKYFPSLPWVADFRDEWTNNPYFLDNPHNILRSAMEKSMEHKVLESATALVTNSSVMCSNFIINNNSIRDLEKKFYVIPNGFDTDDFKPLDGNITKNEIFTITYTGALYGRRKPDLFLESISELIKENKLNKDSILIKFIGNYKIQEFNLLINKLDLSDTVKLFPYMNHDEVLDEMNRSDCLLLIEGGGRGSEAFFTGKVFEYINSKKPILAIIPVNGVAADLIRKTCTGIISDCYDKEKTKKNTLTLYNNWLNNKKGLEPNWEYINKYERKNLTKSLVDIFEKYFKQA